MNTQKRILLIKTHALGDLLLTTPAIHRIRNGYPDARIALLTTAQCEPLLFNNPDIDELITLPELSFGTNTLRILLRARAVRAHHVVVFQVSRLARLIAHWVGIGQVLALRHGARHPAPWPPSFQTYTALAYQELVEQLVPDCESVHPRPRLFLSGAEKDAALSIPEIARHGAQGYAVLAPGGGTNMRQSVPEKRWPAERFAELCDLLIDRLSLPSVIVGSETDMAVAEEVASSANTTPLNLAGQTDLRRLASLVTHAALVVCNDSVVLHMAVALGTPVVGIFGPTSAANFLPPLPGSYVGVCSQTPCSPCYGNSLFPGCKLGTAVCMDEIPVVRVYQACEDRLP